MALTAAEEAQTRELLAQQAAILSLADSEAAIISNLGATDVSLSDLAAASTINDADLLFIRQGTQDKSVTGLVVKDLVSYPDASTTEKGIIELSTQAETQAGIDPVRAVTPATLASVTATDTRAGLIELATAAEILAGDATRAATGATLLAGLLGAGGISANDYIKIPFRDSSSGAIRYLIVQWGTSTSASTSGTVALPITFPTAMLLGNVSDSASNSTTPRIMCWRSDTSTTSVIGWQSDAIPTLFSFIAIGF